ncbi:MAG: hypothetical protein JO032_14100 [Alphaproteobacteria bacterium]|nr:hypothetical protein [Alphaproteobacteria bacterium]
MSLALHPLRPLVIPAIACAGLAAVLLIELTAGGTGDRMLPHGSLAEQTAAVPPPAGHFALPPVDNYGEVWERPLFSATRRPVVVEASQSQEQALSAALAGIVISKAQRNAVVIHGDPPVPTRIKEGDAVDGWTVHLIERSRVVLRRGAAEQQMKLHDTLGSQSAGDTPNPKPRR